MEHTKGIVIYIPPSLASVLRETWKQYKRIADEKTLREAILTEICNLPDRFGDRIEDAKGK